jgi:hypothetical protein
VKKEKSGENAKKLSVASKDRATRHLPEPVLMSYVLCLMCYAYAYFNFFHQSMFMSGLVCVSLA